MSELQVRGPIYGTKGAPAPFTAANDSAQRVQDAHGRYVESVYNGRVFTAANQAAVSFANALGTTINTLALTNPIGSGVHLAILNVGFVYTTIVSAAASTIFLAGQPYSTTAVVHSTTISPRNGLWTGVAAGNSGLADQTGTLAATPVAIMPLASINGSTLILPGIPTILDLAGAVMLTPGTAAVFQANGSATGMCSITWEEIPL